MTHKEIEDYILSMPNSRLDYPFGEGIAVYKASNDRMFALISVGSSPLQISLKCDPNLSELLREKYESVLPGYHLNKRHWITVLMTGQLDDQEVLDLIRHSFELASNK